MAEILLILSAGTGAMALLALLALHFLSPEFAPSWRMISEYATGRHKWAITAFFLLWGASSILMGIVLWDLSFTTWSKVGVVLLILSGVGEIMGGLFDIKHKLHGASFMIGVPTLPIGAVLLGHYLAGIGPLHEHATVLLIASHAPWVSVILMMVTMGVMLSGFKKSGIPMGPNIPPPTSVPPGVIALAGWANRLLVLAYIGWVLVVAAVLWA